ncbi:MAG TPA: DUF1036 domain-containing protein [Xanthobacteraceae bacterium]|nr:DUF1036 domain-containing protein [Xanthobacteraceae bacterium]
MKTPLTLLAAAAALLAPCLPARADFQICNRMSYVVETAVGLQESGALVTRGWYRVDPGQCRVTVEGTVNADRFYIHARALPAYGTSPSALTGHVELCVGKQHFIVPAAGRGCSRPGQQLVRFTEVKPYPSETGWTAYLAEESDYNDEQARLAAVQRLLTINGYDANPIDGLKGRKTDAALAAFLKDRNLPPEAANAPTFFDVLLDATQRPEGTGFVWCNETSNTVMAAVANEDRGTIVTRGWYRVEPGKCTRPEVLARARRIYSYAEAIDGSGQVAKRSGKPLTWGGRMMLCTREASFEISDHKECNARGLSTAGFASVELAAQGATTLRFREP